MGEDAKFKVHAIRETNAALEAIAVGEMTPNEALVRLSESAGSAEHTSPGYRQYRSIGNRLIRQVGGDRGEPYFSERETKRTD